MLRLFKLKQFPFDWGFDPERKASPADEEFELMAKEMYGRFIGKPLLDYRDCRRIELFTDAQNNQFIATLFGEKLVSEVKEFVEGSKLSKEKLSSKCVERARVEHVKTIVFALYHDKKAKSYFFVLGKKSSHRAQPGVIKISNPLAIARFDQKKGSNYIYQAMGLPIISDSWNAVR